MRRTFKKSLALLLALVTIMTVLVIGPTSASAATTPVDLENSKIAVWADAENILDQETVDEFNAGTVKTNIVGAIQPYQLSAGSGNYYLFLPSSADCTQLKLWVASGSTLTVDGTPITSGEPTNIFATIGNGGASQNFTFSLNSRSYTVTVIKSTDVGTVYIDTTSGSLSKIYNSSDHSTSEDGTIIVVNPDGTVEYNGYMPKMSGRGNGTWGTSNAKNPFNVKLETSTSLLGMPAAKKWCLLANSGDDSLVKNQLTYDFADYIGVKYQPHCKPVDLYVNQQYLGSYQLAEKVEIKSNRINVEDAYENLEIANGTIDELTGALIPADLTGTKVSGFTVGTNGEDTASILGGSTNTFGHTVGNKRYSTGLTDPTDYTGGYLYELEISNRWIDENAGFCAYNRQGWVMKSCDYATKSMATYSYNLLYALGGAVYNGGTVPNKSVTTTCRSLASTLFHGTISCTNPAPAAEYQGMRWNEILDSDSAVKYYWTQEFFKNMDSSTSSTYFYKDSDSIDDKLYAGPVWDMDNALGYDKGSGSRWGYSWTSSDGWYTKMARMYRWRSGDSTTTYDSDTQSPLNFYAALATNCTDFWSEAEKYWYNTISPAVDVLTGKTVDETGTLKSIDEYVTTVTNSGIMNNIRFGKSAYNATSIIEGEKNWVTERQTWINGQIPKKSISGASISTIPNQQYTGSEIKPELTVKLSGVELTEGDDYTLSFVNNINAGTATVTVTGAGVYEGTLQRSFAIVASSLSSVASLQLPESAYLNSDLTANLVNNSTGELLAEASRYQWYRDGVAIDGATSSTYTTQSADANTVLTVTAYGDGSNLTGSVTSNDCNVTSTDRPAGYSKTIASWDYDYTNAADALITADETGESFYYVATSGENQATSNLTASVNASTDSKIKWSGSADLYVNGEITDQSPVMGTSKTESLAWGSYPYFQTELSTAGFEDIHFSAKLGGTKKGPRDWKLQYSTDGVNFTDIDSATYSIVANKTLEQAFDDVVLPAACNNQPKLYIRMVVANDMAINGINKIVNQVSGDAAVNNIKVTGTSLSVVTELYAPTVVAESTIFNDSTVLITDNNGGADVYYTVNGGEPILSTGEINPFTSASQIGDTATIVAYAKFGDVESEKVTTTVTYGGIDINSFSYTAASKDVVNGAVPSTGGTYGASGKMTTYADGKSQFVPLWNENNGSYCVSPDDEVKWSANSGFIYKVSTAGYQDVNFSCKAYTTAQGPKSFTLQYSTDGVNFTNVQSNIVLPANAMLENVIVTADLPDACDNQAVLYIRLATTEDLTNAGDKLHNNASKGNLYVNDVVVAGADNGDFKMPYTEKSTQYFGSSGVIEYISPDGLPMQYVVFDEDNKVVMSGIYPEGGIQLSQVNGFNPTEQKAYKVTVRVEEDEDTSLTNTATYYYKGDTVVKFNYNDTKKLFTDYVSADTLYVNNSSGANAGKLSMYPNGTSAATLSYTGTYGVKVGWVAANPFVANKVVNKVAGNGYWLIETSTLGFTNLTLNLEQISSNKGPRDWGIAYSTDGNTYTYVENSNARILSNDNLTKPNESYGNLALPSACDNQEKLYIKVFINGGESIDGTELELVTKGNTGINGVEINGIKMPIDVQVNSTLLENIGDLTGTTNVANVDVYVNGSLQGTTDANGMATVKMPENAECTVELKGDGIATRAVKVTATSETDIVNIAVMAYDVNNDGYVNAKDYAIITKDPSYSAYKANYQSFVNVKTNEFVY